MICELLEQLIKNSIKTQKDFYNFLGILKSLIKKTATIYKVDLNYLETDIDDIAYEIVLKILKTSTKWKLLVSKEEECKKYLYIFIRNYLLDIVRTKMRSLKEEKFKHFYDKEGEEFSMEDFAEDESIKFKMELVDLINDFKQKVPEKEIKYFCYFLIPNGKKQYKCLWANKSKDAIYQDVKRKKNKIVVPLLKEWAQLGVSRETVELFIKIYLSEICEKLRSLYCREVKDDS